MINREITATYYSIVKTKSAYILVAAWFIDEETGARTWVELDSEPIGNDRETAWQALKTRNVHLLPMKAAA